MPVAQVTFTIVQALQLSSSLDSGMTPPSVAELLSAQARIEYTCVASDIVGKEAEAVAGDEAPAAKVNIALEGRLVGVS